MNRLRRRQVVISRANLSITSTLQLLLNPKTLALRTSCGPSAIFPVRPCLQATQHGARFRTCSRRSAAIGLLGPPPPPSVRRSVVTLRQLIIPLHPPDKTLSFPPAMAVDDVRGDMTLDEYEFPQSRLRRRIQDSERTPLVLIACGSFSPITFLHLRMFEMAADYARFNTQFEVVGAYLSCVGDAYKKTGLVKAEHRINMCNLAVQQSSWISVDPWEALHSEYLETAKVLDHFDNEINQVIGGVETPVGRKKCHIALLAGADLIQTMSTPGVWADKDIDYILRNFGAFIVEVSALFALVFFAISGICHANTHRI